MRNIGDTFHFKGYVWEIEDKWKGGYALGRTTKNNKYELNGWVTENYQIFDNNPNKPEQIKRPRFRVCNKCGNSWERVHYCKSKEEKKYKEVERWIVHYEEVGYHDIFEAECERDAVLQASLEYNIIGVWYYDTILKEDK